jgi:hypothetical protein
MTVYRLFPDTHPRMEALQIELLRSLLPGVNSKWLGR